MNIHKSFWAGLAVLILANVNSVWAEDTTVTVNAVIQIAASITNTEALDFGTIIADPIGDTIQIDASSQDVTLATDRQTTVVQTNGSSVTNATSGRIDVTVAVAGIQIDAVFPAGTVTLTNAAADTMLVTAIIANSDVQILAGEITAVGTYYVHVGGLLTIAAGQAVGTYTGTMAVTINYN